MNRFFLILTILAIQLKGWSQQESVSEHLIQFSGIVLSSDSLIALPYTSVKIKNKNIGTYTNSQGFFSLVAEQNDTIEFNYIGFNTKEYIVPDTLKHNERYSIIQLMTEDPIYMDETVVYPWNTKEQFKLAFITAPLPKNKNQNVAIQNLENERLKSLGRYDAVTKNSGSDIYLSEQAEKSQNYGIMAQNNFLNPFAWARFIDQWKKGKYKK